MIAWYDNIPILSWLILRGRCRHCRKSISPRYPLVELAMGVLAVGLSRRWLDLPVWGAAAVVACGILLAVALIDWETFLIPDELSWGLALSGLCVCAINPYFDADGRWWLSAWWSLRGGLVGLGLGWGVAAVGEAFLKKEALGGGDVKLLAGVGAWAGITGAFDCLMLGSLLGSVYGVWLMATGRAKRSDPIPFGPFLAAAAAFNFFRLLPFGWPFL